MRNCVIRLVLLAPTVTVAGCGWLPDAFSGCDEEKPYQSARQMEPLRVPSGAELPDTRNAMRIPDVRAPELPPEPGRCLDHPPAYGTERPKQSS